MAVVDTNTREQMETNLHCLSCQVFQLLTKTHVDWDIWDFNVIEFMRHFRNKEFSIALRECQTTATCQTFKLERQREYVFVFNSLFVCVKGKTGEQAVGILTSQPSDFSIQHILYRQHGKRSSPEVSPLYSFETHLAQSTSLIPPVDSAVG